MASLPAIAKRRRGELESGRQGEIQGRDFEWFDERLTNQTSASRDGDGMMNNNTAKNHDSFGKLRKRSTDNTDQTD